MSDVSIHLASGFLVAGFRHVVSCMWPSDDGVSVGRTVQASDGARSPSCLRHRIGETARR